MSGPAEETRKQDENENLFSTATDERQKKKEKIKMGNALCLHDLPSFIDISPIAHVALLHTDMNCGCKFCPRIGINSAKYVETRLALHTRM